MGIDGIQKSKINSRRQLAILKRQILANKPAAKFSGPLFADVRLVKKSPIVLARAAKKAARKISFPKIRFNFSPAAFFGRYAMPLLVSFFILTAFASGMWVALRTQRSAAQTAAPSSQDGPGIVASFGDAPTGSLPSTLNNQVLLNTPIEDLQSYFAPPPQPDVLAEREAKLKTFLQSYQSPLLPEVDTIAQQPHWQLILAIAFAESTLGKHCYINNCSGIGGSSQIKTYSSLKDWIVDFNNLLDDKRYKDKTLAQMCGVYVQPCTSSWLSATQSILDGLKQQGID